MSKTYATNGRSVLVPMMQQCIVDLIAICDNVNLREQGAMYASIIGHAEGVLNEISFEMEESPDFVPDEEIVAMYRAGMSTLDIAAQFDITEATIRNVLRRRKVKMRRPGFNSPSVRFDRIHNVRTQEMIKMREEGQTLEQIGAHYKITRERVRQILIKAGVDTTTKHLTEREKAAVKEYAEGASLIEVAERYGASTHSLRGWVMRCGVEVRPSPRQRQRSTHTMINVQRAVELYEEGKDVKEIAKLLGYNDENAGTVYRLLAIGKKTPARNSLRKVKKIALKYAEETSAS